MLEKRKKQFRSEEEPEKIEEKNREKESEELSKKAKEIFEEKLNLIKEFDKPKKIGEMEIIKEADIIIYQMPSVLDRYDLKKYRYDLPFEIGIGDPKDRERLMTHRKIKNDTEKKLKIRIEERTTGLLFIEKEKGLNLTIDSEWYYRLIYEEDIKILNHFQDMLERYKIEKLWISEKEENISNILNKLVWDIQSSAYAKKKGMTNVEFLRWRLIECKLKEKNKQKETTEN